MPLFWEHKTHLVNVLVGPANYVEHRIRRLVRHPRSPWAMCPLPRDPGGCGDPLPLQPSRSSSSAPPYGPGPAAPEGQLEMPVTWRVPAVHSPVQGRRLVRGPGACDLVGGSQLWASLSPEGSCAGAMAMEVALSGPSTGGHPAARRTLYVPAEATGEMRCLLRCSPVFINIIRPFLAGSLKFLVYFRVLGQSCVL